MYLTGVKFTECGFKREECRDSAEEERTAASMNGTGTTGYASAEE